MPVMSPQAEDLLALLPNLFQPNGSSALRRNALADQALAQAQQNVPMTPELGTAEFQALQNALLAPPQSVLTQDRELRRFGAEPTPPPAGADTFSNEMNVAIPNLEAQGYRNIGPMRPPQGMSSIGTPEGYMVPPSSGQPGRDINELRMLDNQNKAAGGGMFQQLTNLLTGTQQQQPQNMLSQQEQMMVDSLKADRAKREATMAERQKLVTQNAQTKQAARNFRQEGPDAMMFAQLQQALQGGGQGAPMGAPDPRLALLAPKVYAAQLAAWEAGQNQQRLDLADKRLDQQRQDEAHRFDIQTGLTREGMAATDRRFNEEMAFNRDKADPFGVNAPTGTSDLTQETKEDLKMKALGATETDLLERDKQAGKLTPRASEALEAEYKRSKPLLRNPMMIGSPVNQYYDNKKFIEEMTKKRWSPAVIQQFLEQTGRTEEEPNYPEVSTASAPPSKSWLFPGF